MDWQQATSLLIVAATATILVWSRARRRKFSFQRNTSCGCGSPGAAPKTSIIYHARKGEAPRVILRMK